MHSHARKSALPLSSATPREDVSLRSHYRANDCMLIAVCAERYAMLSTLQAVLTITVADV
jgi:hypothetical protein